jgi:hypothetical protein
METGKKWFDDAHHEQVKRSSMLLVILLIGSVCSTAEAIESKTLAGRPYRGQQVIATYEDAPSTKKLQLDNPYWKFMSDAAGYTDDYIIWDTTPRHPHPGHEMLSGEWGAAIYYNGIGTEPNAMWLTDKFIYPDWYTNSNFQIFQNPISWNDPNNPVVGKDTGYSVIRNGQVEIKIDYEMVDLGVQDPNTGKGGSPLALRDANGTHFVYSERYVLLETYTIKNIQTDVNVTGIEFYQMLHGHITDELEGTSVHSIYETYDFNDPLKNYKPYNKVHEVGNFHYDISQWRNEPNHIDCLGFSSTTEPDVYECGYYEGHGFQKPPTGTHINIEQRTLDSNDYSYGEVAGAMVWYLGQLEPNESVSHTIVIMLGPIVPPVKLTKVDDVNDGNCVKPGDEINYRIDYNYPKEPNIGNIVDVNIIDYLPNEVDPNNLFDPNYNPSDHTYTWHIETLHPGDSGFVTLKVNVKPCIEPGWTIRNKCEIKSGGKIINTVYEDTLVCGFKLDFNNTTDNNDANTQIGFTPFILENNGSEVNGIVIDLSGNIQSTLRDGPIDVPYERIYRDFIYGIWPSGITITLWGLGDNRECCIAIYSFDDQSEPNRVADWTANGEFLFTTDFNGGVLNWPDDITDYRFTGGVQADKFGRIVLTSTRNLASPSDQPFAFVNALWVGPIGDFIPTKYAHRPVPFNGTQNVPVNTLLKWRKDEPVVKHDLYLGTDFNDVNNATRASHTSVLTAPDLPPDANKGYDPYGTTGFLKLDKTYYWRVDENSPPNIYKGEVWNFKTSLYSVIDDFDRYKILGNEFLKQVWVSYPYNDTCAEVWVETTTVRSGASMKYQYENYTYPPYFSEANATIGTGQYELSIDPNWYGMEAQALSLWFFGDSCNPVSAHDDMYIRLADNDTPMHSATVYYSDYGDLTDLRETSWHEWNIPLADFSGVNLRKVKNIVIGFGDGTQAAHDGVVYFDDFRVYATRCALVERSGDLARVDYAPLGSPAGDCVIDYQEIKIMAETWLYGDYVIHTQNPGEESCVAYWPMDEGGGNKIYSHPKFITNPDFCDTNWTGTFNASDVKWETPGVIIDGCTPDSNYALHFNTTSGVTCARHIPSTSLTLAIWVKWAGQRLPDGYCYKPQGIFSERGGWRNTCVRFMFECDTPGGVESRGNGTFSLRQYSPLCCLPPPDCNLSCNTDVYAPDNILIPYIGQWVHLAATFDGSIAILYLNGGKVASGTFFFGYVIPDCFPYTNLKIGENEVAYEVFNGDLDEAYIFNRALTQAEIAYLADPTPEDSNLWVPIASPAEVYQKEQEGQRIVNFKDFALVANKWLEEELFP